MSIATETVRFLHQAWDFRTFDPETKPQSIALPIELPCFVGFLVFLTYFLNASLRSERSSLEVHNFEEVLLMFMRFYLSMFSFFHSCILHSKTTNSFIWWWTTCRAGILSTSCLIMMCLRSGQSSIVQKLFWHSMPFTQWDLFIGK